MFLFCHLHHHLTHRLPLYLHRQQLFMLYAAAMLIFQKCFFNDFCLKASFLSKFIWFKILKKPYLSPSTFWPKSKVILSPPYPLQTHYYPYLCSCDFPIPSISMKPSVDNHNRHGFSFLWIFKASVMLAVGSGLVGKSPDLQYLPNTVTMADFKLPT